MLMSGARKTEHNAGEKTTDNEQRKTALSEEILRSFLSIHSSCSASDSTVATPRRFMTFIRTYDQLFSKKKQMIEEKQKHLQVSALSFAVLGAGITQCNSRADKRLPSLSSC